MELVNLDRDERHEIMIKRHEHFSKMANNCKSLEDFKREYDLFLGLMGIELYESELDGKKYLSMRMQLDYEDYETYHVIETESGNIVISKIIWWQDPYCFNDIINIFTRESVDEQNILTAY